MEKKQKNPSVWSHSLGINKNRRAKKGQFQKKNIVENKLKFIHEQQNQMSYTKSKDKNTKLGCLFQVLEHRKIKEKRNVLHLKLSLFHHDTRA